MKRMTGQLTGQLAAVDLLAADNEARFDTPPRRISDLTDIRFVR